MGGVLAVDFGTSNTVAMIRTPDGTVRPLLFDGSPLLPSALFRGSPGGSVVVGRAAWRLGRHDPQRLEPHPKLRVREDASGGAGLLASVFSHVDAEARRQLGGAPDQVRVTCPNRWDERRRSTLAGAAGLSGSGLPWLIPDAVAVAAAPDCEVPDGSALAVCDLGGGRCDAAVLRRTGTGFEILAGEGLDDVSGLAVDETIVEHVGRIHAPDHWPEWSALTHPSTVEEHRARFALYDEVRQAKETLSQRRNADLRLASLGVEHPLTLETFELLVRPDLERAVDCLRTAVTAARVGPQDLAGIFLAGGSSRIPLLADLIQAEFGMAPTSVARSGTAAAAGALCLGETRRAVRAPRPATTTTSGRLPDPDRSSAVIIGVAGYDAPELTGLPGVRNNVRDLAELLSRPGFGGFRRDRVHTMLDPRVPDVAARVARIARGTEDVLLVYYAGHGLVDEDGDLYLALPGSTLDEAAFTALPFHQLRRAVLQGPARARVAVLDCCYSGRAIAAMSGPDLAGQLDIAGAYTLTATTANVTAHAPVGERHTAFTGSLLDVLRTGVPGAGDLLRLIDLHPALSAHLAARNRPRPRQQGSDTVALLALTRNTATP